MRGGKGQKGPRFYPSQEQRCLEAKSFEELVDKVTERLEDVTRFVAEEQKHDFRDFITEEKMQIQEISKSLKTVEQQLLLEKYQKKIEKLQQQLGVKKT
jgi:hypothetical protein